MSNEQDYLLLIIYIARISFLTLKEKLILLKNLDSPRNLVLMSMKDILEVVGRKESRAVWDGKSNFYEAKHELLILQKLNISWVLYTDDKYPALLREIDDAPFVLFYRGDISCLSKPSVSVVGTRRITPDGRKAAFSFAYDACKDGCNVVSGLAFGVDCEAHKGSVQAALDNVGNGKTIAVLPDGIDTIIPSAHKRLAERILATGGCVLSEYTPGTPAAPWRFVQRNRIIAGLSRATVVIQAPPSSGALLTAQFALDYNRDVLFHEVAFSENALRIANGVRNQLEKDVSMGFKARYKLKNTSEQYINDGAPVVKNYIDYCSVLSEIPGEHNFCKNTVVQGFLF